MKNIFRILCVMAIATIFMPSCDKKSDLPTTHYGNGQAVVLSSTATTIVPAAKDSSTEMFTLSWTNPHYATDSANQKFIIQMDTTTNFTHPYLFVVNGSLSQSYTGSQVNTVLAAFGIAPGKTSKINVRVISSYANNNEQYLSNAMVITVSSYLVPITLTASPAGALTLSLANAASTALSLNWNSSPYGADTINYAVQLDTVGGNFSNPQIIKCGTSLNTSFTNSDLNSAIIAAGVLGGTTKNIEFRVVSYIGTDYTKQSGTSNTISMNISTYVSIPADLYIVGDATPGGWNNPVPTPSQQFTRIDAFSYGMIINLTAGGSYLFLPVNGSWDHKYGGTSATGGTLLSDNAVPGSNTPAPMTSGLYEIIVNFQKNTYTITPLSSNPVPADLYIVGDATPGGWSNPVPTQSQQFTQVTNSEYQLTLKLSAAGSYLFLPVNGSWDHKFGGTSATGGTLLADGAVPGSNTPGPAADGTYLIDVNFLANTYSLTKQ